MNTKQTGMTLIELVIVIVVLGVIASVAAPQFAGIKTNAVNAEKNSTIAAIDTAYTIATAKALGKPTVQGMFDQVMELTCTLPSTCSSRDKDGTSGVDVKLLLYSDDCTTKTATEASITLVLAYAFDYNATGATDCRAF